MVSLRQAAMAAVTAAALLAASTAAAAADVGQGVGLACAVDSDCGYLPSLACVHGRCDYCRPSHADCGDYAGDVSKRCAVETVTDPESGAQVALLAPNALGEPVEVAFCIEKDLFSPFTWTDALGTLIAFASTALGSGCGIGGGGLLVPLYIFVMGLSPKHAIPLSKATIFGNAVAIYIFNFGRKHPNNPNVPIIDYAVSAAMEPMTLVGTVFGVMLNKTLPNWLILVLLMLLLAATTYKTAMKGVKLSHRESREHQDKIKSVLSRSSTSSQRGRRSRWSIYARLDVATAARHWLSVTRRNKAARETRRRDVEDFATLPPLRPREHSDKGEKDALLVPRNGHVRPSFGTFANGGEDAEDPWAATRAAIQKREATVFPVWYVWPLVASWLIILGQSMLRGGHGSPSVIGVECGSENYWLLTLLPLGLLVGLTAYTGHGLRLLNRLKVLSGCEFAEGDIHWIRHRVVFIPALCVTAGVAAGLLGIGGGMVKGPIMLEMGILPAVQSATTSFMILFTSSSTTLQFAINGQFPGANQYDYVLWFIFVGFVGGLAGQYIVDRLVRRFKRESIIIFIMSATIGLSAIAMGLVGLQSTLQDIENGVHLGLHGFCDGT